ncbi:TetR/AcrR family transcriptional regulator [Iningainema tapete]|uniref:TetR/AcrR family transcriptional regulator n=1 Tax=Iningainema tapete BLCC-T55 TaxID=2748662 RepID=A0A8J7BZR3_9CYAN|nr:TetR/AcrR family transcriptional regulator [Iningainema tapete]MBD2776493.1 TetR/AcrR family transcriptional regulator [Iningainema tapete BLCC-T55]
MTNQKPPKDTRNPRADITAAAYRLLAEKGYEAVTMKEIARAANVAPGLIHYYFENKDQLLQEVLQEAGLRYVEQMKQLTSSSASENILEAAFAEPKQRVEREPEWFRIRCELFALGLRNPQLRPSMTEMLAKGRQCISEAIDTIAENSAVDSDAMAAVLLACFDGLAVQKLADPTFDIEGAYNVLIEMSKSLLGERS